MVRRVEGGRPARIHGRRVTADVPVAAVTPSRTRAARSAAASFSPVASVASGSQGREPSPEQLQRYGAAVSAVAAQEGISVEAAGRVVRAMARSGAEGERARERVATALLTQTFGAQPSAAQVQAVASAGQEVAADPTQAVDALYGAAEQGAPVEPTATVSAAATEDAPPAAPTEDEVRARIAEWAVAQANDPNVGYAKSPRFGQTAGDGHRYFDCSGLCTQAYRELGISFGSGVDWTGAMRQHASEFADEIPKDLSQMKPGDLLLMDGHVVMYIGNGQCVGAQTSHAAFDRQVRADIDAQSYLNRPDCIVLRPHISPEQVAAAASTPAWSGTTGNIPTVQTGYYAGPSTGGGGSAPAGGGDGASWTPPPNPPGVQPTTASPPPRGEPVRELGSLLEEWLDSMLEQITNGDGIASKIFEDEDFRAWLKEKGLPEPESAEALDPEQVRDFLADQVAAAVDAGETPEAATEALAEEYGAEK